MKKHNIKGYALLRFGNVCDVDEAKGYVRVELDEDGITTHWIPVIFPRTKGTRDYAMPDVNTQVACLMDENCEEGVVLGSPYSSVDKPTGFGNGKSGVIFEDGTSVTYDPATKTYTIKTEAKVVIDAKSKVVIKNQTESLKAILADLLTQLQAETHPTPSGMSGIPTNEAQYAAILARVNALFD